MTLYINEILGRLLQTQGFEQVLEKDLHKPLPAIPSTGHTPGNRIAPQTRASFDAISRRDTSFDISPHHQIAPQSPAVPPSGIGVGLSRAFSFRRKRDSNPSPAVLRPLKLVEEQRPGISLRSDGIISHAPLRSQTDDDELEHHENKAKRVSWVPGWFSKPGTVCIDEK
jgi:hypothetical protein